MKTFRWNKYTNVALLVLLLGLIVTGVILESVLPPGSGQGYGYHRGHGQGHGWRRVLTEDTRRRVGPKTFLALGRHDWGKVHFWLATVFTLGIVLHLALNWTWIRCAYLSRKNPSSSCENDS